MRHWLFLVSLWFSLLSHAAPTKSGSEAEARTLASKAKKAFEDGNYKTAASLLERATQLSSSPTLLYNLGRARERSKDLAGAIEAYESYLETEPPSSDATATRATVNALKERIEEQRKLKALEEKRSDVPIRTVPTATLAAPEPKSPATVKIAAPPPKSALRVAGPWVTIALGAAALGVGIGLGFSAQSLSQKAAMSSSVDEAVSLQNQALAQVTGANVASIGGGIVLTAGLTWLIVELVSGPSPTETAAEP
jgi:tetratricopeptide (TPR) repeat protein